MNNRVALAQLTACLRGGLPTSPDWAAILVLANRALVTAQLYSTLLSAGVSQQLPEEVQTFLLAVFERNRERNRRLSEQLGDALRALNAAGIEPVLLKGAGVWASSGQGLAFDRILADIDLMVDPSEVERALEALNGAGFLGGEINRRKDRHAVAMLGRPIDPGFIDLHQRPPGPVGIAHIQELGSLCTRVSLLGGQAKVPVPAIQVFLIVLHDQFHDGDYWRGGFDLRHLMDIAALSRAPQGVDWRLLDELCRTALVRNVLGTQLVAAERLMGAVVPANLTRRWWIRAQHQRHMWQFTHPAFADPLVLAGILAEWRTLLAHRRTNEARIRQTLGPNAQSEGALGRCMLRRAAGRASRIRRALTGRAGKL